MAALPLGAGQANRVPLVVVLAVALMGCAASPTTLDPRASVDVAGDPSPLGVPTAGGGLLLEELPSVVHGRQPGAANQLPPGISRQTAVRGLELPTAVQFAPDGRVLVAEQRGTVQMYATLGDTQPVTIIDIRTQVFNAGQLGLLGLALDPDFEHEPYIYVAYTFDAPIGGTAPTFGRPGEDRDSCPAEQVCLVSGRISRFLLEPDGTTAPEHVLLEDWCNSSLVHTVGTIAFDSTGALLAAGGDGAQGDELDVGQLTAPSHSCAADSAGPIGAPASAAVGGSLRSQGMRLPDGPRGLNGTLVRVDRATGDALPDNPLFDTAAGRARLVLAYGLRNPFRFLIVPGTRQIWLADPGWNTYEELNHIADFLARPVPNLGWPCYEGPLAQPAYAEAGPALCVDLYEAQPPPVLWPAFSAGRASAAGQPCHSERSAFSAVVLYDQASLPKEYAAGMMIGDAIRRCIWFAPLGTDGGPDFDRLVLFATDVAPVDLKLSPDGRMVTVDYRRGALITFE